jgi:23S rRNA (guanosine2251-2'-O)-methyltransferase
MSAGKAGRAASLAELAAKHGVTVRNVSSDDILRLIPGVEHRGYALETDSPAGAGKIRTLEDLWPTVGEDSLVMLLDGITDPRNLGAVMRAAGPIWGRRGYRTPKTIRRCRCGYFKPFFRRSGGMGSAHRGAQHAACP